MRITAATFLLFAALALFVAAHAENVLYLDVGDPARRDRQAPVMLDAITDTGTGEFISTNELMRRLENTGILFLGEEHTNLEFHRVQANVIRALHESGRQVLIALDGKLMPSSQHHPCLSRYMYTRSRL